MEPNNQYLSSEGILMCSCTMIKHAFGDRLCEYGSLHQDVKSLLAMSIILILTSRRMREVGYNV